MDILINITLDMIDDTSDQIYVIFDLLPFTQYSFHVRAFSLDDENETLNLIHIGIASDEIIVRTDEDGKILLQLVSALKQGVWPIWMSLPACFNYHDHSPR